MPRLYLASNNLHKAVEMRALLAPLRPAWDVSLARDAVPGLGWEENGDTFLANARIKAETLRDAMAAANLANPAGLGNFAILADDSGLEVDVLGGAPGVISARYAGVDGDDAANNTKLLAAIAPWTGTEVRARFVCILYFLPETGEPQAFSGFCEGKLCPTPRGHGGFGYDPLFIPDAGNGQTLAELDAATKNVLSHRAKAVAAFAAWLQKGS